MRARCNNSHVRSYKNYGGRGIKICDEWNDFERFYNWAMSNGYSDILTIERIDCNGNYCPDNCKWIPKVEQALNRRNTLKLIYNGEIITPNKLSEITGISVYTIYSIHRERETTDFSNYKLKKGVDKYITRRTNGYEVTINKKYCGKYKTLEDAKIHRDLILKEAET
jgi:hypothetical protein